ncbi:MAG: DUF6600 domain-containing protein [Melioribacteraceae bacterium]
MKKTILTIAALFIIMSIRLDAKPGFGISFGYFYSSLRPYGEWIQLDNDLIVWRPGRIDNSWRPYSEGRWSWTSEGWYWDSYEPFGWATYHYGRWFLDDYYGWIWIPDYEWAPSWVEWRYDDDYIGWAPLPPYAGFRIDLGIHFSIGWHSHYRHWNFVGYNHFYDHRVYRYFLDSRRSERIFSGTKYRTNYYSERDRIVNGGVDRSFIERRGGYKIRERSISTVDSYRDFERSRGERGERVYSYRPSEREIEKNSNVERYDVKRGENRTSLEREKISTPSVRTEGRTVITERAAGRSRELNSNRRSVREDGRTREESGRNPSSEQMNREAERERGNIEAENNKIGRPERDAAAQRKTDERVKREVERERQPAYIPQQKSERQPSTERRVEPRRESNYERPAPRVDRGSERSQSKSSQRESGKSDRRR